MEKKTEESVVGQIRKRGSKVVIYVDHGSHEQELFFDSVRWRHRVVFTQSDGEEVSFTVAFSQKTMLLQVCLGDFQHNGLIKVGCTLGRQAGECTEILCEEGKVMNLYNRCIEKAKATAEADDCRPARGAAALLKGRRLFSDLTAR